MIDPQHELDRAWNGYKIEAELGEGAFGKVYRISRKEFGHSFDFAVKILEVPRNQDEVKMVRNEGLTEDSVESYFYSMVEEIVAEFTLMYQLKGNSNIVSYEDHAVIPKEHEFGWVIFIRMELLRGFSDILNSETLTQRDYLKLGMDMCRALEECEKFNIIHRDIKPQNIFRSDFGHYKLGDFGIARQMEKTSAALSRKGTPSYMAPEVYQGRPYDRTVDIYSLGILLYRCLNNNRTPFLPPYPKPLVFADIERANMARLSGQEMPDPCNASPALSRIIKKACAYLPKDRYQSALSLRRELKKIYDELAEEPEPEEDFDDEATVVDFGPIGEAGESEARGREEQIPEPVPENVAKGEETTGSISEIAFEKEETTGPTPEIIFEKEKTTGPTPEIIFEKEETTGPTPEIEFEKEKTTGPTPESVFKEEETAGPTPEIAFKEEETARPTPEIAFKEEETSESIPEIVLEKEETGGLLPKIVLEGEDTSSSVFELEFDTEEPSVAEPEPRVPIDRDERTAWEPPPASKSQEDRTVVEPQPDRREDDVLHLFDDIETTSQKRRTRRERRRDTRPETGGSSVSRGRTSSRQDRIERDVEKTVDIKEKKEKSKAPLAIGLVAGGGVLAAAVAGFLVFSGGMNATPTMPELTGMTEEEATEAIEELALSEPTITYEYSDSVAKGAVISQNLDAKTKLEENVEIELVVSKGVSAMIPDVTGKTKKEAKAAIEEAGLSFAVKEETSSEKVAEGHIISQNPKAKQEVDPDTKVSVVVSTGKAQVTVPDVAGFSLDQATAVLSEMELQIETEEVYSDSVESGKVISQNTGAGEMIDPGSTVLVQISKGPEPVQTAPVQSQASTQTQSTTQTQTTTTQTQTTTQATAPVQTPAPAPVVETPAPAPVAAPSTGADTGSGITVDFD